ncbi:MAG: hypothetical protein JWO03_3940 [Bacteroidetes bacterium]|nr:hypothetical protein [Bacteroidota bacterium]
MEHPLTKKHHYIPEFFIKNFCDEDGKIYIYDKLTKRYLGKKSPGGIFYEMHRNTIDINGTKTDNFEKLYSALDDRFAKAIIRVITTKVLNVEEDLMSLLLFASTLKWRVPAIDASFKELKENLKYEDLPITIKPVDKNDEVNAEMLDHIINSNAFKESMRTIIPSIPFLKSGEKLLGYNDGSFIYTDERIISVLGDCGLVEIQGGAFDELNSFVMPLSSHTTFVYKAGNRRSIKSLAFFMARDLLSVHRSERYVGCKSKEHLENVINTYNGVSDKRSADALEHVLFEDIS